MCIRDSQNAYHEVDTYTSLAKQRLMLKAILDFHHMALDALEADVDFDKIMELDVRDTIARMKYVPENEEERLNSVFQEMKTCLLYTSLWLRLTQCWHSLQLCF